MGEFIFYASKILAILMYLKMQEPSFINKKFVYFNKVQIFCPSSTQGATIMWKMQKKYVLSNVMNDLKRHSSLHNKLKHKIVYCLNNAQILYVGCIVIITIETCFSLILGN